MLSLPLFAKYMPVPFISLPFSSHLHLVDLTSYKSLCITVEKGMTGGSPPHPVVVIELLVWLFLSYASFQPRASEVGTRLCLGVYAI